MDKLTIATQVLLKLIETNKTGFDAEGIAGYAWEITDAMQAEADKRKPSGLPEALKGEWQPDWSQAPSEALSYHIELDELDGSIQPFWTDSLETHFDGEMFVGYKCAWNAPSFNYQGNWQDSLRKRPQ